jgi:hypothetical protein
MSHKQPLNNGSFYKNGISIAVFNQIMALALPFCKKLLNIAYLDRENFWVLADFILYAF